MTATLANGGKLYRPQLVEQVVDAEGKIIESFSPELMSEITGLDHYFDRIKQGMEEVVQGKHGTARNVAIDGLIIAGKTGRLRWLSSPNIVTSRKMKFLINTGIMPGLPAMLRQKIRKLP